MPLYLSLTCVGAEGGGGVRSSSLCNTLAHRSDDCPVTKLIHVTKIAPSQYRNFSRKSDHYGVLAGVEKSDFLIPSSFISSTYSSEIGKSSFVMMISLYISLSLGLIFLKRGDRCDF